VPSLNQRCSFPGCQRSADHRHHVLGDEDENWVEGLCKAHHKQITLINTEHSGPGYKLFGGERKQLYRAWKRGELKPIGNPNDDPRIAEWD
jgi:hypothetical protein